MQIDEIQARLYGLITLAISYSMTYEPKPFLADIVVIVFMTIGSLLFGLGLAYGDYRYFGGMNGEDIGDYNLKYLFCLILGSSILILAVYMNQRDWTEIFLQ